MEGVQEEDPNVISATTSNTESECDQIVNQLAESIESQAVNQIPVNPYTGLPQFILRPYTADTKQEDIVDWFELYENLASDLSWNDRQRLSKLPLYLDGTAKLWYNDRIRPCLDQEGFQTYNDVKKKMINTLIRPNYRSEYHRRMTTQKQGKDQCPITFAIQMQALCRRVDRNMTESTILSFIREGIDCRLKPWINNKKVRTVDELLEVLKEADTWAEESEAIYREIYMKNSRGNENVNEKMLTVISNLERTVASLNARINGMSRNAYGQRNYTNNNNQQMPARQPPTMQQTIICYRCQESGHKSNVCPNANNSVSQNRGNQAQNNQREGTYRPTNYQRPPNNSFTDNNNNFRRERIEPTVVQQIVENRADVVNTIILNLTKRKRGKLVYAEIQLDDQIFEACIDSGSEISLITQPALNILRKPLYPYRGPGTESASNNPLHPIGECDLRIRLKAKKKEIIIDATFVVINSLPCNIQVLLGQDICEVADLWIGAKEKVIRIGYEETSDSKLNAVACRRCLQNSNDSLAVEYDTLDEFTDSDDEVSNVFMIKGTEKKYDEVVISKKIESHEKDKLIKLLDEYEHIFSVKDADLGYCKLYEHRIDTGDHAPIHSPPYKLSSAEREKVRKIISSLLEAGIIEESNSPCASPIVVVPKKDGEIRMCVDYRPLNAITKPDKYPLPRIDSALDALEGAQYFSLLDLRSGFYQIGMHPEDKEKTAFIVEFGLYQFNRLSMGLVNSASSFQRVLEKVLAPLKYNCCLVYIDDIVVFSKNFEEHLDNLEKVFKRLDEAGLRLKPSKCEFALDEILYLGHIVGRNGQKPDEKKLPLSRIFRLH